MPDASIPADIAASPVGQRLQYVLGHIRTGGRELTDGEIETNFVSGELPVERLRQRMSQLGQRTEEWRVQGARSPDRRLAIADVEVAGQPWCIAVDIEPKSPHRIRAVVVYEVIPGLDVRVATESDRVALREIELRRPVVSGETKVVYDRGEDYFAAERLMGDAVTYIGERDGQPLGLLSTVIHDVSVNGRIYRGRYGHRLRVLPGEHGVASHMGFVNFEANSWRADFTYTFIAAGNVAALRRPGRGGQDWSLQPERVVIDTALHSGPPIGRPATPSDAGRIVALLNGSHSEEELYVPYTAEFIELRVERERGLYSWRDLRLGQRSVVGVWPAHIKVIRESAGATETDDRALVLDYGCESGAEDELVALIRAECSELAAIGTSELTIFTSLPSRGYTALTALAKRIEPYVLTMSMAEPPGVASRGIYVDQLYF